MVGQVNQNNIAACSLVAVVFKDTVLVVNPVFQLHPEAILIFSRMCSSVNQVNIDIPWLVGSC